MHEHEIDRLATGLAGTPRESTLIERAVDRLTAVLVGSLGTRSWRA